VSSPFRITATDGGARAGVLDTAHGPVETPVFMPVGTKASVKAMLPSELRDLGARIVLANAYHLYFRPGAELIDEMGGVARFSGWDGPVLTDSGGFQVFSLLHTATRIDDEGVRFRSVYDGSQHHFTPEVAMRVQRLLRSDIAMAFDECPPAGVDRARVEAAVRRTGLWAARSRTQPRADGQLGFGIVQGGIDLELRRRSAEEIVGIGFDGYAVGGLSVGEEREPMLETLEATTGLLPADRPRYLMGVGDPVGLIEGIARGVDMFDCVLPTRLGRTGSALVPGGRINLRNAAYATDQTPLAEGCTCPACTGFSRAYIRHLITQSEISGLRLLTMHNLHHLLDLAARARAAIAAGSFADLRAEVAGSAGSRHHESVAKRSTLRNS
jgi:queuine tRNA-ribosyltransferase